MGDLKNTVHRVWYNNQPHTVEVVDVNLEKDEVTLEFQGHYMVATIPHIVSITDLENMKEEYRLKQVKFKSSTKNQIETWESEEIKGYSKTRPKHYDTYGIQVLEMMEKIFGIQSTIDFCKLNAFKYRMRMGTKSNETFEDDYKKEQYYLEYANKLKEKL